MLGHALPSLTLPPLGQENFKARGSIVQLFEWDLLSLQQSSESEATRIFCLVSQIGRRSSSAGASMKAVAAATAVKKARSEQRVGDRRGCKGGGQHPASRDLAG